MEKHLLLEIKNSVATITLNRPDKHNAFNDEFIHDFIVMLDDLASKDIHLLCLKANGKSFSAGADLSWMQKMVNYSKKENMEDARQLATLLEKLYAFPAPTVACVQGAAFGGGVGLIACCDIAIASENATFCFSEVKLGLSPSTISPYVINKIGLSATQYYFLTAKKFSAKEAKTLGLVQHVVSENELIETSDTLTQALVKNGPEALKATKTLINRIKPALLNDKQKKYTSEHIAERRISEEAQERLQQFLNKMKKHDE